MRSSCREIPSLTSTGSIASMESATGAARERNLLWGQTNGGQVPAPQAATITRHGGGE